MAGEYRLSYDRVTDLLQVFCRFDQDGDGRITSEECKDMVVSLGHDVKNDLLLVRETLFLDYMLETGDLDIELMLLEYREKASEVKNLLHTLDKDLDGFIYPDELRLAMTILDENFTDEDLRGMLRRADLDPRGPISYNNFIQFHMPGIDSREAITLAADPAACRYITKVLLSVNVVWTFEFSSFVRAYEAMLQSNIKSTKNIFSAWDKNRDGFISQSELGDAMRTLGENMTENDVKEMLLEADLDGDGQLSFEEFVKVMNPSIKFKEETVGTHSEEESEDMSCTYVDSAINRLSELETSPHLPSAMKEQIQILQMDFIFLKLYIWCLTYGNLPSRSAETTDIEATLGKSIKNQSETRNFALENEEFKDQTILVSDLLEAIQLCKSKIKGICLDLMSCTFQCEFPMSKLQKFMDGTVISLNNLVQLRADLVGDLKVQMETLGVKLNLISQLIALSLKRSRNLEPAKALAVHVQVWTYSAACLSILYWAEVPKDENIAAEGNTFLPDLHKKIKPQVPEVMDKFLGVLQALKALPSDIAQTGQIAVNFVDLLLGKRVIPEDGIETFREGLTVLIIFLMEKPDRTKNKEKLKLLQKKADAAVKEAAFICSPTVDESKESVPKGRSIFFHNFIKKIDALREDLFELFPNILDSSSLNYPVTNLQGFVDCLLKKLEEKLSSNDISIPSMKHQFLILQKELQSLKPSLKGLLQLHDDESKKLCRLVANSAYHAANALDSSCYEKQCLWNEMTFLSKVTKDIKLLTCEIQKSHDQHLKTIEVLNVEMSSNSSMMDDEIIVGFEDDSENLIDQLTRGSPKLTIVSIIGIPGIGKTTLAKKVYNHRSVQFFFHKRAWSSGSCQTEKVLANILANVGDSSIMEKTDLEQGLYKSLKGRRYLIVLDNIWDIKEWDEIKQSFPDDGNGSRILFTSRTSVVAPQEQGNFNFLTYTLNPLSDGKSWELLRQKVFKKDDFPPEFSDIGRLVAKRCRGMPLAIVVIAGLLQRRADSLFWWEQIADSTGSMFNREEFKGIVELSYQHLPDFLKPCFLYLGLFKKDEEIKVQKLIRLWISEGFVQNSGKESLEKVGAKLLEDLAARSLVTITSRSSTGGIKSCRLHDLLREFCSEKAEEENFCQVIREYYNYQWGFMYMHYRLCVQFKPYAFLDSNPAGPCIRSLMVYPNYTRGSHGLECFRLTKFQCLQVLDIADFEARDHCVFEGITSLVLLRYLAVNILSAHVPSSISKLVNLETICVVAKLGLLGLPETIWTMNKLRHIDVSGGLTDRTISSQYHQPGGLSPLKELQTFSKLHISEGDRPETLLKRMPRIRKLNFVLGDNAPFPMLQSLSDLESLNMAYMGWKNSFLEEMNFPSTIKKLTMIYFRLPWNAMSLLRALPNLEVLKLRRDAFYGKTWEMEEDEQFLKLKFLELYKLNFTHWNASADSFPCLEQLVVNRCYELEQIPSEFEAISTLKMIKLCSCKFGVKESARKIQNEQYDMGNKDLELIVI